MGRGGVGGGALVEVESVLERAARKSLGPSEHQGSTYRGTSLIRNRPPP